MLGLFGSRFSKGSGDFRGRGEGTRGRFQRSDEARQAVLRLNRRHRFLPPRIPDLYDWRQAWSLSSPSPESVILVFFFKMHHFKRKSACLVELMRNFPLDCFFTQEYFCIVVSHPFQFNLTTQPLTFWGVSYGRSFRKMPI